MVMWWEVGVGIGTIVPALVGRVIHLIATFGL